MIRLNIWNPLHKSLFFQGIFFLLLSNVHAQQKINFDQGWKFAAIELKDGKTKQIHIGKNWNDQFTTESISVTDTGMLHKTYPIGQEMDRLQGEKWQSVTLPHTAFPEPLVIEHPRQGLAYYKKTFSIPAAYKGKRVSIFFEGAMQIAWIWFNGKFVKKYLGGYLPFRIDISELAKYGGENTVFVKLDNRDNPQVPPGKPVAKMDFLYYSGLYRDVWLEVCNPLHITDPNAIDRPGGGGVFVTYPKVGRQEAVVDIQTNVQNESNRESSFSISQELLDSKGNVVAHATGPQQVLKPLTDRHYVQQLVVTRPSLWSPDSPNLYQLKTTVLQNGKMIDRQITRIGIRSFSITKENGLMVNGIPLRITGSNRHMSYPWIGNALSNNANTRDAILIKNAGMNCIRLAHYPQDPSFYDACDSLGILLLDCVPGWQFFNKSALFQEQTLSDIRQMIRRDRNHPSVLLWEVSLNETYPPADFRCRQVEVAKSEWPSGLNFYTSGDSYFTKACYDVPYDDWADNLEARNNTTYPDRPFLIREYGDFEFGGTESTTRQLRGNGEKALLQQAWNLQWEHNRNRQQYPRAIGDLTWAFYDGLAGYVTGIEGWGLADIKRIPKYAYYFFQSQLKANAKLMCYIANYWTPRDTAGNVIVYSNCDEVRLWINGREIAHQLPDDGPNTHYGPELDKGGHPFGGGDTKGLSSPPFTFKNIAFQPGELKAVGYKNGQPAAQYTVYTPGKPVKLSLSVATQGIPLRADGADAVFVHAQLLDKDNHPVHTANNAISFSIEGDAKILSPAKVNAEAGIATILLQAGLGKGEIRLTASGEGLESSSSEIYLK